MITKFPAFGSKIHKLRHARRGRGVRRDVIYEWSLCHLVNKEPVLLIFFIKIQNWDSQQNLDQFFLFGGVLKAEDLNKLQSLSILFAAPHLFGVLITFSHPVFKW